MTNAHIERTKRMIEVMQAYVDGEEIECIIKDCNDDWTPMPHPAWAWASADYRIAKTPDIINWDHVAPEFKYMARDAGGNAYLYNSRPSIGDYSFWPREGSCSVRSQNSYRKGTTAWKDSLVIRPGCE